MKTRKIPEGWRILTPTERVTTECRFIATKHLEFMSNTDPTTGWTKPLDFDIGMQHKEARYEYLSKKQNPTYYIYIKPKKQSSTELERQDSHLSKSQSSSLV